MAYTILKTVVVSVHVPGLSRIEECLEEAGFKQILTRENLLLYADKLDAIEPVEPIDGDSIRLNRQGISYSLSSSKYAILDLTFEFEGLIGYFDLEDQWELEMTADYLATPVVARRKISEGRLQMPSL